MKISEKNNLLRRMPVAAMFLSSALLIPFLTGQISQIGNMFCLMHIPVLLCGFFCGPWYGLMTGAAAPLLRFVLFGQPQLYPTAVAMCFELAAYGFMSGMLYGLLPKKTINVYISLIVSMFTGRIVWGMVRSCMYGLGNVKFGWTIFITEGFVMAIPGIVLQLVLVPILVIIMKRSAR